MQICSVFIFFLILAHTSNECNSQIHMAYNLIFLTATSAVLKSKGLNYHHCNLFFGKTHYL